MAIRREIKIRNVEEGNGRSLAANTILKKLLIYQAHVFYNQIGLLGMKKEGARCFL